MENNKSYYAVIPANVRYSDVPPNAKLLYGEITALSNEKGYCWASNAYFAKLYNVANRTVSLWVGELKKNGFIQYEIIDKNTRHLFIVGVGEKADTPRKESSKGVGEKAPHNTTVNTTVSTTTKEYTPSQYSKQFFSGKGEAFDEIIRALEEANVPIPIIEQEVAKFISYWTEPNKSGTKERWELQRTFDVKRRLGTWFRNASVFNGKQGTRKVGVEV